MRFSRRRRPTEVHSITSVQRALSEDVDDRMRRYAFSMAVRTACVIVAIFSPSPWNWISLAGAVVIPVIAVLVANAGRELPAPSAVEVDPWGLPAGPSAGEARTPGAAPTGRAGPDARPTHPAPQIPAGWTDDPTAEYLR